MKGTRICQAYTMPKFFLPPKRRSEKIRVKKDTDA